MIDGLSSQLEKENKTLREELKKTTELMEFYKKKSQQSEESYNQLLYAFKNFRRHRFGSKRERFVEITPQGDLFLKDTTTTSLKEEEKRDTKVVTIASYKRRKRKAKKFPKDFPRRTVIIPADKTVCKCGKEKRLIRYEITELLDVEPIKYEIIEQKREIIGCPCGCQGSIVTAPNPVRILPKVKVTERVLSHIIISKLHDRQPFYHLEKKFFTQFGIDLSRETLARWFIETSKALQPLINLMRDEVIDYDVASIDPTWIQVLDEPNRLPMQKSYWYCIRGGPPEKSAILYDYNATQHKKFLINWFEHFKGYIHTDAENIYDALGELPSIKLSYCNVHSRRKYEAITKIIKKEGLAHEAMRIYRRLFRVEREAKERGMGFKKRYSYRLEKAKPILNQYKTWLKENYPLVLPKSPLGQAMKYSLNHWERLTRYLEDGRLEIDNNGTEREIKPGVIARKNFLFSYSVAGAKALCIHMSLIRTSILHGLDPYHYYVEILKGIPHCKKIEDYETLLPWNIILSKQDKKTA